jgi:WD40 repeat protein
MAIHPKMNIVATGQMALGGDSKLIDIFIWDADTKAVLGHINDFHQRSIVWLEFSPDDGIYLLTAG